MPSTSMDTFFACSIMVVLISAAMVATAKLTESQLTSLSDPDLEDQFNGFAEYILLNPGSPSDWGTLRNGSPDVIGLASASGLPYQLDPDKVTRLNEDNAFALNYPQLVTAFGARDIVVNIEINMLLDVSIRLISTDVGGTDTTYTFQTAVTKQGAPDPSFLKGYLILDAHVDEAEVSTDSAGVAFLNCSLPNSLNGTALLLVFAEAQSHSNVQSFSSYAFGHNGADPEPDADFVRLNPLDHVLNVSKEHVSVSISNAYVFTCNYGFNLTELSASGQSVEYAIPWLVEASPLILVVNGYNASTSFAESTAYPQLPLQIGADFGDSTARGNVVSLRHVVSIGSVLYESVIRCRRLVSSYG
jgi:hypothetical protein